ncbi:DUF6538 domain-containing protein [Pseudomonas syringae]
MAQPFKHPQSGVFYFRRRVPDDLRPALGREYKRSLQTRDIGEAKGRHAAEWIKSEEAFALARAQLSGAEVLSAKDVQQLAARWFHRELDELEQSGKFRRALVPGDAVELETPFGFEQHQEWLSIREALNEGDETDWRAVILPHMLRALKAENIPAPAKDSPALDSLTSAFKEHLLKLSDIAKRREEGDWSTTATEPCGLLRGERGKGMGEVPARCGAAPEPCQPFSRFPAHLQDDEPTGRYSRRCA